MIFDSDDSNISDCLYLKESPTKTLTEVRLIVTLQLTRAGNTDILDKLCASCIGSKSTQIIRYNKNMTVTTNMLKEIHADFRGSHNLLS